MRAQARVVLARPSLAVLVLLAALASCGVSGDGAPGEDDGVRILERRVEPGATGIATGDYFTPGLEYAPIPLDPRYTHVLNYQMTPMSPPALVPLRTNGPVVVYDDELDVVVLSPLDHFFSTLVWFEDGALRSGIEGEIDALPAGFTHRFLMVEGQGIRATMQRWGDALRALHGRERPDRYADAGLARLGYWTDNGAYYYYATEPGMNEADTLLAVKAEADARSIPYGYVQLDSWWYFKTGTGATAGLVRWEPQPWMFPLGLAHFRDALGLPLVLHNRWFAPQNSYRDDFDFVEGDGRPPMALPTERGVYDRFMRDATTWGAVTYEQDWLMIQYWGVPWLRAAPGRAESWMANLDDAAAAEGLTMQLTMPGPGHLLDSVDRRTPTSARVSIDYLAGAPKSMYWPEFLQTSLFAWSVGLWPFKDTFQSSPGQRGLLSEARPEAEALLSTLSGAMVGPGDRIGAADRELLMRTCRSDGLLLKPDAPALPLDAMFLPHARPYWASTESRRDGLGVWTYLAGFRLERGGSGRRALDAIFQILDYDLPPEQMFVYPDAVDDWHVDLAADLDLHGPVVAYDWRRGTARVVEGGFDVEPIAAIEDHAYLVLAPILSNGLALIGEPAKFVTLADRRFVSIETEADAIRVALAGAPGERVELLGYDARLDAPLAPMTATLGADGRGAARLARRDRPPASPLE